MSDFVREVNEEVRKDRYLALWLRYRYAIIGVIVVLVIGTASVTAWNTYQQNVRTGRGALYETALAARQARNFDDAISSFGELAETNGGYGVLARLRIAEAHLGAGRTAEALAVYDALAADAAVEPRWRELADLLAVINRFETETSNVLRSRLDPLTRPGGPWRYNALELSGLLAHRAGDIDGARALFTELADDAGAPPAIRARASELLAALEAATAAGG